MRKKETRGDRRGPLGSERREEEVGCAHMRKKLGQGKKGKDQKKKEFGRRKKSRKRGFLNFRNRIEAK